MNKIDIFFKLKIIDSYCFELYPFYVIVIASNYLIKKTGQSKKD